MSSKILEFCTKVSGCWTTEVRSEKYPKNFSPRSDLFWSPSGRQQLWPIPLSKSQFSRPRRVWQIHQGDKNIHLYISFSCKVHAAIVTAVKPSWKGDIHYNSRGVFSNAFNSWYCHLRPFITENNQYLMLWPAKTILSGLSLHFVNWMLADSKVWYLTQQIRLGTVNTWECGRDAQPRHRDSWPSRSVDNTTGMSLILTRYNILSLLFSWKIPLWSL